MALILENLAAVTISCCGKLLSWSERGILLGEITIAFSGIEEDERICFAVEAKHNVCLAGATRFETFYPELKLPLTSYILENQQGTVTFLKPSGTLPETVMALAQHLQKYLRRQINEEDSFEDLIGELKAHRTQFVRPAEIEKRVEQALQLLEMAFEQCIKTRLRRYAAWQEIRAEMESMCAAGGRFIEEFHFNHDLSGVATRILAKRSAVVVER